MYGPASVYARSHVDENDASAPPSRSRIDQGRDRRGLDRRPRNVIGDDGRRHAGQLLSAGRQGLANQKVDIAAAKKLLAEAGHPDGFDLTLTTIIGYDWMDAAGVILREQLGKVGIRLAIQRVELGVWVKNFQSKQMGFTFNDWATVPDPNLLFYRHFHKAPEGADFRNWKNDAASKLLDEGRVESDPAKRRDIYVRYQQVMAESVPTIMLFSADHVVVRGQKVQNYDQHPTGWIHGLAAPGSPEPPTRPPSARGPFLARLPVGRAARSRKRGFLWASTLQNDWPRRR
ncbi:hypothetical protein BTHI11S_02133 [Bosea thiooxidans]